MHQPHTLTLRKTPHLYDIYEKQVLPPCQSTDGEDQPQTEKYTLTVMTASGSWFYRLKGHLNEMPHNKPALSQIEQPIGVLSEDRRQRYTHCVFSSERDGLVLNLFTFITNQTHGRHGHSRDRARNQLDHFPVHFLMPTIAPAASFVSNKEVFFCSYITFPKVKKRSSLIIKSHFTHL